MEELRHGLLLTHNEAKQAINMPSMHVHAYHELYMLISGRRRYFIGHSIWDVEPGDLVPVPQGSLHRTTALQGAGFDRYLVYFSQEEHRDFCARVGSDAFEGLMQGGCLRLPPEQVRRALRIFEQMEREQEAQTPLSRAVLAHLLEEILLLALRYGRPKDIQRGESADKIQEVARYISLRYAEPISLREAAQMAYMEATYFSKRFRRLTGFGFHEYVMQTRLGAAERLLVETAASLSEVAERCGFSSANYFGDVFRRYKGISPSDFRKGQ